MMSRKFMINDALIPAAKSSLVSLINYTTSVDNHCSRQSMTQKDTQSITRVHRYKLQLVAAINYSSGNDRRSMKCGQHCYNWVINYSRAAKLSSRTAPALYHRSCSKHMVIFHASVQPILRHDLFCQSWT